MDSSITYICCEISSAGSSPKFLSDSFSKSFHKIQSDFLKKLHNIQDDFILINKKKLIEDVEVVGNFGRSNHVILNFKIQQKLKFQHSRSCILREPVSTTIAGFHRQKFQGREFKLFKKRKTPLLYGIRFFPILWYFPRAMLFLTKSLSILACICVLYPTNTLLGSIIGCFSSC